MEVEAEVWEPTEEEDAGEEEGVHQEGRNARYTAEERDAGSGLDGNWAGSPELECACRSDWAVQPGTTAEAVLAQDTAGKVGAMKAVLGEEKMAIASAPVEMLENAPTAWLRLGQRLRVGDVWLSMMSLGLRCGPCEGRCSRCCLSRKQDGAL